MSRPPASSKKTSRSILLVEDDAFVRQYLVGVLESLGYEVTACSDGPTALAEAARPQHHFNLLITDVMLPGGLLGREVADTLARDYPQTRVLFISGYPEHDLHEKGILRENVLLLKKPFRRATLAKAVHEALYSNGPQLFGSAK
ncbi:MAG TPA: response regulator [Microvirga sp.]|jgi:CheY-like chemotaxis protein|nr:response regulator [Microvirga sp.]